MTQGREYILSTKNKAKLKHAKDDIKGEQRRKGVNILEISITLYKPMGKPSKDISKDKNKKYFRIQNYY